MNTNDPRNSDPVEGPEGQPEDEVLEVLFTHAKARKRAPLEDERDIRTDLHAQWREMTRTRKRRRVMTTFGLAASFAAAVLVVSSLFRVADSVPAEVATVVKQSGTVMTRQVLENGDRPSRLESSTLFTGQQVETSRASLMALDWSSGESIRMDENTKLTFLSATEIELLSGRIYIDSGDGLSQVKTASPGPPALLVRTFAGDIRHLGTQYIADLTSTGVEVIVREGRVAVGAGGKESIANPGEQLIVSLDGETTFNTVSTFGELWAWTEELTPPFELDGRTILDFLEQVARETGRKVAFQDSSAENLARTSTLRGSIDLAPMRALELVLQTTDLVATMENGSIEIRTR